MALNINTSRLNDALRQMASFFMQNKLGEMSQQRQMDTYSEQDRLMRERSAAEEVAAQRGRKSQYDLDISKAFKTGGIKAIGDPVLDGWRQRAELAKEQGDMVNYELFSNKYAAGFTGFVRAAHKMQTGEDIPENEIQTLIENSDIPTMMSAVKERNVTERDLAQRPIQERQTKVAESNAFTSAGNLRLEKDKFGAEQGGPGVLGDKQRTEMIKYVSDAMDLLTSQGVIGEKVGYAGLQTGKTLAPLSPQNFGKALTSLAGIHLKLIQRTPLSPSEMQFPAMVRDAFSIEGGETQVPEGSNAMPKIIKGQGLPSVQTGLTGPETADAEAKINQNMLGMITNQIMQRLGLGEDKRDYATQLAREFLAGLK